MQAINIRLYRHDREADWSVEIDGKLHQHVSEETVDGLVEYAVIAAEQRLLEHEGLDRHQQKTSLRFLA
jgi:hypothetical protein